MAEDEIVKHTRKIYKIWNSNEHSFWQKTKEFLLEILIIVFAVTLSIWVHDKSEKSHQQKEVKEFLLGLKGDLKNDVVEMKEDRETYHQTRDGFRYIFSVKLKDTVNQDSLNNHADWLFNTTGLVPNNGRFEGFKSSGKIGTIENKELQNDIMDLYQEEIPSLLLSTDLYTKQKTQFFDYVDAHRKRTTDSTTDLRKVLATEPAYNFARKLKNVGEIVDRYDSCIAKMEKIIAQIDKEYGVN